MLSLTKHMMVGQMGSTDYPAGIEVPLRRKNQITLPAEVARALEASPGDRLVFTVSPDATDTAIVRRIRGSYFGALAGSYGATHAEQLEYIKTEHESWGE